MRFWNPYKKNGYRQLNVRQLGIAYAPGTIAVNVTWIEREFNACQTPRSMYPSIFNNFWDSGISVASELFFQYILVSEWAFFNHILLSPGYAPGTIAVNVTWIEREFNACQTHRSMYIVHTYLQTFTSYSEILVGNRNFFLPPCILRPRTEWPPGQLR